MENELAKHQAKGREERGHSASYKTEVAYTVATRNRTHTIITLTIQ